MKMWPGLCKIFYPYFPPHYKLLAEGEQRLAALGDDELPFVRLLLFTNVFSCQGPGARSVEGLPRRLAGPPRWKPRPVFSSDTPYPGTTAPSRLLTGLRRATSTCQMTLVYRVCFLRTSAGGLGVDRRGAEHPGYSAVLRRRPRRAISSSLWAPPFLLPEKVVNA